MIDNTKNVNDLFIRTEMLIGTESLNRLKNTKIAVFGLGGVGSYVVEGLSRGGIGEFIIVDSDTVASSNINRQIIATTKTVGQKKTDVSKQRINEINPLAKVTTHDIFYSKENCEEIDLSTVDYVIDAIDTVTAKLLLIERSKESNTKIISCMGTGNKLNPTMLEIEDIYKTSVCPLAKVMRHELKKRQIDSLKVLYSKEIPQKPIELGVDIDASGRRTTPASISFVPSVAGLIIASEVIKDIISTN